MGGPRDGVYHGRPRLREWMGRSGKYWWRGGKKKKSATGHGRNRTVTQPATRFGRETNFLKLLQGKTREGGEKGVGPRGSGAETRGLGFSAGKTLGHRNEKVGRGRGERSPCPKGRQDYRDGKYAIKRGSVHGT